MGGFEDEEEELLEDVEESAGYVSVPHKKDLDLGRRLVMDFVYRELPGDADTVEGYFHRRGAYSRLKDLLRTRGMLERWYEFEERATDEALRAWAEENGIRLVDAPPGGG
jgi:hypothetical protein